MTLEIWSGTTGAKPEIGRDKRRSGDGFAGLEITRHCETARYVTDPLHEATGLNSSVSFFQESDVGRAVPGSEHDSHHSARPAAE